jgi:Mg2+/Co2+ transporter CorB
MSVLVAAQCVTLVGLFCFSAFFSSAETAYFSLNPIHIHRIRRYRPKAARRIEELLAAPTQILSTLLIGNTLVNITASIIGFSLAERVSPAYGEAIAIPAMTLLILMFGDVVPKRVAVRRAEQLAVGYVPLLAGLIRLLTPARVLMDRLTASFQKYIRTHRRSLTEEEFQTAVGVSQAEGALNREERAMVDGIIRLERVQASQIMTPRVDMIGIDADSPVQEQIAVARKARFRYLPVYRGTLDHIEGFLDVFRFLLSPAPDLRAAMIKHFYVPDTATLDSLLTMFQHDNLHVAIVIDEYGGTAGLITRGDILEEIVQEVDKRDGAPRLRIEPQGEGRWLVDGGVSLQDINYRLNLKLEAAGAERIAGWLSARMERLPKPGDVVEAQGCRATVWEVKRYRIRTVLLEKLRAD